MCIPLYLSYYRSLTTGESSLPLGPDQTDKDANVAGILCLNIFLSVLAYRFWNSALREVQANKVCVFLYPMLVYTMVISILFLGERLRAYQIIEGLLFFTRVFLVTLSASTGKISEGPD